MKIDLEMSHFILVLMNHASYHASWCFLVIRKKILCVSCVIIVRDENFTDADVADESSEQESDQENINDDGVGCVRVVNLGMHQESPAPAQKLWALILTPTRELAVQIKDHMVAALKYTDIKVGYCFLKSLKMKCDWPLFSIYNHTEIK